LLKKRFDETLLLISQQKDPLAVDIETILKVENGYLQHIMKLLQYIILQVILGDNFIYNLMTQDGPRVLITFNLLMLVKLQLWEELFPQ
jgi:hypothetical protein